jgi:L-serine dehydratase
MAGLLGISPEDEALSRGEDLWGELRAQGKGFHIEIVPVSETPPSWHPNSLVIELTGKAGQAESVEPGSKKGEVPRKLRIRASSIGGGSIRIDEIDGYQVNLSGDLDALLVMHHDEIGVIAMISQFLAAHRINIAGTSSHRKGKGQEAMLVVETDGSIPEEVAAVIRGLPPVYQVFRITTGFSTGGPV